MSIINEMFQPMGLAFKTSSIRRFGVERTAHHGVVGDNDIEQQFKTKRRGDAAALNLYIVGDNPNDSNACWATFPHDYLGDPQKDGIVCSYDFLPGGSQVGYNTGKIVAHEIGHWVGLYHTFEDVSLFAPLLRLL
jgi:hypothetical protein